MNKIYRLLVPTQLRQAIWQRRMYRTMQKEYRRDQKRFILHSGFNRENYDLQARLSRLMIEYHRLEKGLSLPNPRPGFGKLSALQLIEDLELIAGNAEAAFVAEDAFATLTDYYNFQKTAQSLDSEVEQAYDALRIHYNPQGAHSSSGGVESVNRQTILKSIRFDYEAFTSARHSIRNFSDVPVELSALEQAVRWAQNAPSVCNRQPARVWLVTRKDLVADVAELQRGCRGFKESIDKIIVITVTLKRFVTAGERNQGMVDGGIFLMSLLLSLHASGLGACPLNWCVGMKTDDSLRRLLGIPEEQSVISLIAVGNLPENLKVAKASRIPTEQVLKII